MGEHAELLARHRNVLPSWMALYYEEPIAIVEGEGRHVWPSGERCARFGRRRREVASLVLGRCSGDCDE